jgi:large repetitive protein
MKTPRVVLLALVFALGALACSEEKGLSVKGLSPAKGPYIGGDPVVISGTGFNPTQGVTVYFGGKRAPNPVIDSSTKITVMPPGGEVDQAVDVKLVFADGQVVIAPIKYTYIDPLGQQKPPTPPPAK